MKETRHHAPEQQPRNRSVATSAEHDQIGSYFPGGVRDVMRWLRPNVIHDPQRGIDSLARELSDDPFE